MERRNQTFVVTKNLMLFVFALICLTGCRKHQDDQNVSAGIHEYKGILVTDDQGNEMGWWGTGKGDWENDANWSSAEYALLNFPDTISLSGTFVKDTTGWNLGPGIHEQPRNIVAAFPNPANGVQLLYFHGLGLIKFKATIVDKYYNRLLTRACKDSVAMIQFDLSDTVKFKSGILYRLFYSLSATDRLNFYKGHGDIMICRGSTLQECLTLVPL